MPIVVVTGATGAIGSATVAALVKRRAQVVSLSRPALDLSSRTSVRAASRHVTRLSSTKPERAAHDLVDLALSPAHAGTTGWFFKGTRQIDAPKSTLDTDQQSELWKRSAELVELENGF